MRLDHGETNSMESLFNFYEALRGVGDFGICGGSIRTIKYPNDLVLLAEKKEAVQGTLDKSMDTGRK